MDMYGLLKKILLGLFIIGALILIGYMAYQLYQYAVEDATRRIRSGASKGVSEGVGKGLGGVLNPLNWTGR